MVSTPSAPRSMAISASSTARSVELLPAPASTGTRPFARLTQISTTRRCSSGAMRDLDQIIGRIEKERVQPKLGADARRRDRRIELSAAAGFHFACDLERRAARGVLLLRVVALFYPARVLRKAREQLARAM